MGPVRRQHARHTRLNRDLHSPRTWRSRSFWALAAVFLTAAFLRLRGIDFGLPDLNDPDELMFELGSVRMLSGPTLNPGWFGHPATTTMYLLAITNALVFAGGWLGGFFASPEQFANAIYNDPSLVILPGRLLMAAFAMGTIALLYRLTRILFDRRVAMVAAFLLAINSVHITYSQIIRSDMMACFFMLLCMLAAQRIGSAGRLRDYLLAALWLGLALATKWPFALAGLPVALAAGYRVGRDRSGAAREVGRLCLFAAASIACLLVASPYLILDFDTVRRDVLGEAQPHHLGATGGGTLQDALWYLEGPLLDGAGPLGLAFACVGIVVMVRHYVFAATLVLPLAAFWFVLISVQTLIFERWALPLMPLLAMCTAVGLVWAVARVRKSLAAVPTAVVGAAAAALVAAPVIARGHGDYLERTNDTRQEAARWARQNIPAGSTVLVEHFGFGLLSAPWDFYFPVGDAGCVDPRDLIAGQVKFDSIQSMRGARHNVDWGTMPEKQRRACTFDYAIVTQMDRYHRERDVYAREDAAYRELLARGEVLASWYPPREKFGLQVTRIIRMKPRGEAAPDPKPDPGRAAPQI